MAEGCGEAGGDFRHVEIKVYGPTLHTVQGAFQTWGRVHSDEAAVASAVDFAANAARLAVAGPGGRKELKVINPENGQLETLVFEQKF